MKNEGKNHLKLYRIMSSKDQINRAKKAVLKDITLMHINNKIKDTLNPLNEKIQRYSKKINKQIKNILNTSDIIYRAKKKSYFLKDILLELDKDHANNMKKFKTLRERTNDLKNVYLNIQHLEKEEEKNNSKNNIKEASKSNIDINIKPYKETKELEQFELSREKIHNLLSDNILLMAKRREIFSYYLIRNKYFTINDEKRIRYIDKIRELLEIKQIKANKLMTEKEKKIKMENNKFYINQKKRIKAEKLENYNKMCDKIRQENELSLRSIKETNATLNSLRNNKSFLDEDIKLKFDHNYSQPSLINKINIDTNNNKKMKLIKKISAKFLNRDNKSNKNESNRSLVNVSHLGDINNIKSSRIKSYIELIKINNKENEINAPNESTKSIINLRRLNRAKSLICSQKNILKNKLRKKMSLDNQIMSNNSLFEDESKVKSRMTSVYEEIKKNNVLLKKDEEFIRNYFIRKKAILSKKPSQAVTIMSNSLSRINNVDITKKWKRIHGMHIPEKYSKIFDNLESIDNTANCMKGNIYDSICKVKMDD